jgi:hypothetical protein
MRYLLGFICVLALGVMGCGETTGTGGSGGDRGVGGEGGDGGFAGVGGGGLERLLQNTCVRREIGEIYFPGGRTLADGRPCDNHIYTYENICGTDPLPVASNCVHYCAFDRCQPEPCQTDTDCDWMIESTNTGYECLEYTIQYTREFSYGTWCREKDPDPPPGFCDHCGGAFCAGDCVPCPQCTG